MTGATGQTGVTGARTLLPPNQARCGLILEGVQVVELMGKGLNAPPFYLHEQHTIPRLHVGASGFTGQTGATGKLRLGLVMNESRAMCLLLASKAKLVLA